MCEEMILALYYMFNQALELLNFKYVLKFLSAVLYSIRYFDFTC